LALTGEASVSITNAAVKKLISITEKGLHGDLFHAQKWPSSSGGHLS
jgi:hypothetical protein